jgi:hypothetical protein
LKQKKQALKELSYTGAYIKTPKVKGEGELQRIEENIKKSEETIKGYKQQRENAPEKSIWKGEEYPEVFGKEYYDSQIKNEVGYLKDKWHDLWVLKKTATGDELPKIQIGKDCHHI